MLNIVIKTIPHDNQRYPTVGDWICTSAGLTIYVSDMKNWRYELLVALHELAEWAMCRSDGVSQQEVDEFDQHYDGDGEPGDSIEAPYRRQHFVATNLERELSTHIRVDWPIYEKEVNLL